jgi:hypothetical protein
VQVLIVGTTQARTGQVCRDQSRAA